jgi:CBS domain-containing protein
MRVSEICKSPVITCFRDASATAIAALMREQHVGDVIVVDTVEEHRVPVGIVTDRDLVVRILAAGADAGSMTAAGCMTRPLVTACEDEDVYDVIWRMRSKGVRRFPVVDARNRLRGIITAQDVSTFLAEALIEVARTVPQRARQQESALDDA